MEPSPNGPTQTHAYLSWLLDETGEGATKARIALDEFDGINSLLSASNERVSRLIGPRAAQRIARLRQGLVLVITERAGARQPISHMHDVELLAQAMIGYERHEHLLAIYLDARQRLIRAEIASMGTIDTAPVFARTLMARALELGAAGMVMCHNHPSGIVEPSKADIEIAQIVARAAQTIDIQLLDSVIVGRGACYSMRARHLI